MKDEEVTQLLVRLRTGDQNSEERLFVVLSQEMRRIASGMMRQERIDHTLQPSAVVNEAIIKLLRSSALSNAQDRRELLTSAVRAMKQVLIDHARERNADKRIGGRTRNSLDMILDTLEQRDGTTITALTEALETLRAESPRQAQTVELRFFSGLEINEIVDLLEIAPATVKRDLLAARARLAELLT